MVLTVRCKVVLDFNTSKLGRTMKNLTDVTKLNNLGWKHKVSLEEGIASLCNGYTTKSIN
ncbi:hypothetical protein CL8139_650003 [Cellulophaga lytica]|nr:hypothetical protein CL8139_650003 [Cellulophaga lytica]